MSKKLYSILTFLLIIFLILGEFVLLLVFDSPFYHCLFLTVASLAIIAVQLCYLFLGEDNRGASKLFPCLSYLLVLIVLAALWIIAL